MHDQAYVGLRGSTTTGRPGTVQIKCTKFSMSECQEKPCKEFD